MKKIFNRSGMTLIEVIAATIILGVIVVPIYGIIIQAARTNISTETELKMNNEAQRIIEDVKATGVIPDTDSNPLTDAAYCFTRNFEPMYGGHIEDDPTKIDDAYYKMNVTAEGDNIIATTGDEYERWDFKVELLSDGTVAVWQNQAARVDEPFVGQKNFKPIEITTEASRPTASSLSFNFLGLLDNGKYRYTCTVEGNTLSGEFDPLYSADSSIKGNGYVDPSDNIIVVNVVNNNPSLTNFTIEATNKTIYRSYTNETTNTLYFDDNQLQYNKNVIVNILGDNPSTPKVVVNSSTGHVDTTRNKVVPQDIHNGREITIEIQDKSGNSIKKITSVISK